MYPALICNNAHVLLKYNLTKNKDFYSLINRSFMNFLQSDKGSVDIYVQLRT